MVLVISSSSWPTQLYISFCIQAIFLWNTFEEWDRNNLPNSNNNKNKMKYEERKMMVIEIKRKHYGWVGILIVVINIVTHSTPPHPRPWFNFFLRYSLFSNLIVFSSNDYRVCDIFEWNLCLLSIKTFPYSSHLLLLFLFFIITLIC